MVALVIPKNEEDPITNEVARVATTLQLSLMSRKPNFDVKIFNVSGP